MQDKIPDALIAAFERHYAFPWDEPTLRNERLAWRAAWAEATKPCLLQIQEPSSAEQAAWHAGLDEGRAQAVPAAVAVPDGIAAFEKLLDASMAALTDRSSAKEHVQIWDDAHDVLEAWKARATLAATPAAAVPVVLPEPVGAMSATTPRVVAWNCTFMPEAGTHLYTDQQVRALLAGVSAPAAQTNDEIHADFEAWWGVAGDGRSKMTAKRAWTAATRAAPQTQADAREAQLLAFAVSEIRRDEMEHAPVLYVSKGQLDNFRDPDGPDSTAHGRYLPARVTPAGKFTTPLFAAPQAQADALDALAWLEEFTCDLRCVSTSEDDYAWNVIEHHMAEPRERVIGWGQTAIAAVRDAQAAQQGGAA